MEELIDIKSELTKELDNISNKLQIVRSKITNIGKLESFKGKAAASAKVYFQSVHVQSIDELEQVIDHLKNNYESVLKEFKDTVDNSSKAIIYDEYLNDLNKKVLVIKNDTLNAHEDGKQIIQEISDIVSISNPNITSFETSVDNSQKYVAKVNERLNDFDNRALNIIKESQQAVEQLQSKVNMHKVNCSVGIFAYADQGNIPFKGSDITGGSAARTFLTGIKSEEYLKLASQFKILIKSKIADKPLIVAKSKKGKKTLRFGKSNKKPPKNKDIYLFTKDEYRVMNNQLSFGMYKYNTKDLVGYLKRGMDKSNNDSLMKLVKSREPYGKERGKLAMNREFEKLFGLDKYKELRNLTPKGKTTKAVTMLWDELIGDKLKATSRGIKLWKNPKVAFENGGSFLDDFKAQNPLSKSTKIAVKGLGLISTGIIIKENIEENKGDIQKVVVGTAVDLGVSSTGAAIGTVAGSFIIPPIGTVVGAGVGVGISYFAYKTWGKPPRNLVSISKDALNSGVDSAQKASKEIGRKITGWFK